MGASIKFRRLGIYCCALFFGFLVLDLLGIFRFINERDYKTEFSWPLDVPNFREMVLKYSRGEKIGYNPVNTLYKDLKYTDQPMSKCDQDLRLLVLVKSAPSHFEQRDAIRNTWGFERRFSDVAIKVVFLLGQLKRNHESQLSDGLQVVENRILDEISSHHDILRADFLDTYYNNTYKLMMGMRWAVEECNKSRFVFFVDDDMYVSMKNLLLYLRHPTGYPDYWEGAGSLKKDSNVLTNTNYGKGKGTKVLLPDYNVDLDPSIRLYTGYVFFVKPVRSRLSPNRKWYLDLTEYPFSYYPPYVPAGTIVMSRSAMTDIYYASLFTQDFRFDDVFVGFCAKKMGIEPYHSDYYKFWSTASYDPYNPDHKYVITAHGYSRTEELTSFWTVQKQLGHA